MTKTLQKNLYRLAIALLHTCNCLAFANTPIENEVEKISIRVTPKVGAKSSLIFDQAALREIAEVSEPQAILVKSGTDVISIFNNKYAKALSSMWPILLEANHSIKEKIKSSNMPSSFIIDVDTWLILPPGPKLEFKEIKIQKGDSISEILYRNVGSTDKNLIEFICSSYNIENESCNRIFANTTLKVPIIEPISVTLNSESQETYSIESFKKEKLNNKQLKKSAIKLSSKWSLRKDPTIASSSNCLNEIEYLNYEDKLRIEDSLSENQQFLNYLKKDVHITKVVIADSGIAENENNFDRLRFASTETGMDVYISEESSYPLATGQANSQIYHHGTHVSGILFSASSHVNALKDFLNKYVRMSMYKITNKETGLIDDEVIFRAINNASISTANIVNMSIESQGDEGGFSYVKNYKNILFVFSAGNESQQKISNNRTSRHNMYLWPLMLGAANNDHVIVVGAHGENESISQFSNSGRLFVDLGAPGVCVSSFKAGEDASKIMSGTSQAAPLVSMVASILYSYDVKNTPWIKYRILSAVDFNSDLIDHYYSSGNLNIAKSIRIFEDIIVTKKNEYIYGAILNDTLSINKTAYEINSLMKIAPYTSDSGKNKLRQVYILKRNANSDFLYGIEDSDINKSELSQVIKILKPDGEIEKIILHDISDIVLMPSNYRKIRKNKICEDSNYIGESCKNHLTN